MTAFTALLPLAVVAVMHWRRARTLAARGHAGAGWRQASFALGITLAAAAQLMPLEDELFFVHMLQHVLLGDLAALVRARAHRPLLRPILVPWLAPLATSRTRSSLPLGGQPLPLAPAAAVRGRGRAQRRPRARASVLLHDRRVVGGRRRGAAGPEWFGTGWKFGYVAVVRLVETALGNVLSGRGRDLRRL